MAFLNRCESLQPVSIPDENGPLCKKLIELERLTDCRVTCYCHILR